MIDHSQATALGMRRWWRETHRRCLVCRDKWLIGRWAVMGMCAECEWKVRRTGCVCTYQIHPVRRNEFLCGNRDACPLHGFGTP